MTQTRTDIHAPRAFNPAEYLEVGYFDNHPEEGGCWIDDSVSGKREFTGNYMERGRCDHCGAGPLRYGVVFLHVPSDELVVVGTTCAHRLGLASRSQFDREQSLARAIADAKREQYRADNPDVHEFLMDALENGHERFDFVLDIGRKLRKYGSLSEKQTAAIRKIMAKRHEQQEQRDAEPQPESPLAEGRYVIEGEVLSHKWQDGFYGTTHKMLVRLDDGNKVWGTVPTCVEDAMNLPYQEGIGYAVEDLKGHRVRLTATVERSNDDEHFGFFKRPAKAEVLTPVGAVETTPDDRLAQAAAAHPAVAAAAGYEVTV